MATDHSACLCLNIVSGLLGQVGFRSYIDKWLYCGYDYCVEHLSIGCMNMKHSHIALYSACAMVGLIIS